MLTQKNFELENKGRLLFKMARAFWLFIFFGPIDHIILKGYGKLQKEKRRKEEQEFTQLPKIKESGERERERERGLF